MPYYISKENKKINKYKYFKYYIIFLCRLRKGDRKLFESSQSLEKTYNKCSDRLKQCQKKTTVARNEYLLSLATTNAHLHRHATEDLPCLMRVRVRVSTQRTIHAVIFILRTPQVMDGEMYERARNAYMLYAQIEADAANLVKADFEDLREQSYLVGVVWSHKILI